MNIQINKLKQSFICPPNIALLALSFGDSPHIIISLILWTAHFRWFYIMLSLFLEISNNSIRNNF